MTRGGVRGLLIRVARTLALGLLLGAAVFWWRMQAIGTERLEEVKSRVEAPLRNGLQAAGLRFGTPVFVRIFKEENELELWLERKPGERWQKWKTWKIANFSGKLGPKLREGDMQAPEGFYEVGIKQLNPLSHYHLSFNLGYPNAFDRHHGRTGSLIMVHGSNVSVGCFAMTDPVIEEIYLLVEAALKGGQKAVPVHVFPFRLTQERLAVAAGEEWEAFWREELLPGYAAFEASAVPPKVEARDGHYRVAD